MIRWTGWTRLIAHQDSPHWHNNLKGKSFFIFFFKQFHRCAHCVDILILFSDNFLFWIQKKKSFLNVVFIIFFSYNCWTFVPFCPSFTQKKKKRRKWKENCKNHYLLFSSFKNPFIIRKKDFFLCWNSDTDNLLCVETAFSSINHSTKSSLVCHMQKKAG